MKVTLLVALTLLVCGSAASAQTKPAPTESAGGAYYEFMIGLHLESQGDNAGASAAYQRAERLDPQSAEIPAALAELYVRMNRPADAIEAGERAVKANPANPEANWVLGTLYARMADMPNTREPDRRNYMHRAIANLEKANRNAHPAVTIILARLYLADRQYEKAVALLAPFVNEQPEEAEAVALLADAYQATDRDAEAISLLEKSVEESPELFATLGQVYQDAGRWEDAARAYQGAVEQRPQSLSLRVQWATSLLNAGDSQRAREVLEEGSAGNSRNSRALYLLSEAQRRLRDYAAAEVNARRLIALDLKALGGPRQLAQIFRDQREHQKVVGASRTDHDPPPQGGRCGRPDERHVPRHVLRPGHRLRRIAPVRQGHRAPHAGADACRPRSRWSIFGSRDRSRKLGKAEDAVRTLQAAVARFPKEPGVMLSLASALERDGKYREAEGLFRQMIAADPNNADALNSLGYMLAERGQRLDEAVALVERALAIDPDNGAYLDSLGWAYYKQNRFEQAEKAAARCSQATADRLSHSGSPWRSSEQARPLPGSHRCVADGARWRWRIDLALRGRRQDQIGAPEAWSKKVGSASRSYPLHDVLTACGPRRIALPAGPGTPLPDYAAAFSSARGGMRRRSERLQAELALSGRAAGQRMRGRVHAGLIPGALRLEGVAPFGSPVFILVAEGVRGTLLLLRDRRVLEDAPPEEILNALVGIRLGAR